MDDVLGFYLSLGAVRYNHSAPFISILLLYSLEFGFNYPQQTGFGIQYGGQLFYQFLHLCIFLFQIDDLEAGQLLQTHVQYGLCLNFGKIKFAHQSASGFSRIPGGPDYGNHFINIANGNYKPFQNMSPCLCPFQIISRSSGHYILLVVDIIFQYGLQTQLLRFSVGDGNHIHAKCNLQIRVFIQVVQNLLCIAILFDFNNSTYPIAIGFVPDIRNTAQHTFSLFAQPQYFFQKCCFIYLIGQFLYNQQFFPAGNFLGLYFGPQQYFTLSCLVCLLDFFAADDDAAGWEIRSCNNGHQLPCCNFWVVNYGYNTIYYFAQVVRRNIGSQPYCYA